MTHFLDEAGKVPTQMPKEARELANFLALIVDETTKEPSKSVIHTTIRCFKKKCEGTINSEFTKQNNEIHWKCSKCQNEGILSEWQNTRWNNR